MQVQKDTKTLVAGQKLGGIFYENDFHTEFCGLTFYSVSPQYDVTIREFEGFAIDRLKVLHAVDRNMKSDFPLTERDPELEKKMIPELKKAGLYLTIPRDNEDRQNFLTAKERYLRRDQVSHFVLRLAFCKNRESREWFIKNEKKLLQLRAVMLTMPQRQAFYASTGFFNFRQFEGTAAELADLQRMTTGARIYGRVGQPSTLDDTFYAIPFTLIPAHFIAKRKVVLKKQIAFVPNTQFTQLVQERFKRHLDDQLNVAFDALPKAMSDPRVSSFLKGLQDCGQTLFVAKPLRYSEDSGEKLTLMNFEIVYQRSFPPCMRRLVETPRLPRGARLKHQGKLQLRPFLKDAGLDLEDSLAWWRQEVLRDKEMSSDKFTKNHVYDIEHTYGKKGHMKEQNSFGCATILNFPYPSVGQVHGCPFKHMETEPLFTMLKSWGLPESSLAEIDDHLSNGKHYQLACQDYFRATHPGSGGDGVGNHPDQFYEESCNFCKKSAGDKKPIEPTLA
eukprot:GEMP01008833.1.p1 GENE.GEMP01008833.1~~GEMP01008833.1.p1  ORF type:complete len:504 (-),score=94.41 GEMP01008833.1:1755-3266(-)